MVDNYRYVRFKTNRGIGYALFRLVWDRDLKDTQGIVNAKVSVAFCNPNDNFVKSRARKMVDVRLRRGKYFQLSVSGLEVSKSITNNDFMKILNEAMFKENSSFNQSNSDESVKVIAPNWARKAFMLGKVKLGLTVENKPMKDRKVQALVKKKTV